MLRTLGKTWLAIQNVGWLGEICKLYKIVAITEIAQKLVIENSKLYAAITILQHKICKQIKLRSLFLYL